MSNDAENKLFDAFDNVANATKLTNCAAMSPAIATAYSIRNHLVDRYHGPIRGSARGGARAPDSIDVIQAHSLGRSDVHNDDYQDNDGHDSSDDNLDTSASPSSRRKLSTSSSPNPDNGTIVRTTWLVNVSQWEYSDKVLPLIRAILHYVPFHGPEASLVDDLGMEVWGVPAAQDIDGYHPLLGSLGITKQSVWFYGDLFSSRATSSTEQHDLHPKQLRLSTVFLSCTSFTTSMTSLEGSPIIDSFNSKCAKLAENYNVRCLLSAEMKLEGENLPDL
ncbi:hypothetical protein F5Y18DRAFT_423224 [Xylariaceae sp. FL1019]|nr:hypothetical protein F5Y18DRAFT_423224 [Xylariaceae sp. FL1019]